MTNALRLFLSVAAGLCLALTAQAQSTGTITGRIFNPATQEYVRNAEVRVEGTNISATSEEDGSYQLFNVPPGVVTVVVVYTGYNAAPQKVMVSGGETATQNFELTAGYGRDGDTIKLEAVVVAGAREGNAKAIQSQKRNMNLTTTVASDIFGDVTDGNVGEFLKFLPGVDVDYVESETRGPRLGGMDAQYVGVTFDGNRLASADANRTGDLGRATSFEAFSISAIEAIEISRTTSSDMDADSPAGTINLKTRRAFDRRGRQFRYNVSANLNSEEFTLRKTYGPGADKEYKWRPNYSFEYSDVFFNQRLGILASVNHVDSYTEQYRHNITYNRTTTATDTRPMVATSLNFKDGNKNIEKDTFTLTVDYKASDRLSFMNTFIYNYALGQFFNREFTFNTGSRAATLGDGVTEVRTSGTGTGRNSAIGGGSASKRTHTRTYLSRFEYKLGSWTFDGGFAYSGSFNNYEALEMGHTRADDLDNVVSDWVATRSSPTSYEWTVRQLSGPDWFNLDSRKNPRAGNEGRRARTDVYTGDLNARWVAPFKRFPTIFKFGTKWAEEERNNGNQSAWYLWSYTGPNGGPTGSWAFLGDNPNRWNTGTINFLTVQDLAGNVRPEGMPRPNSNAIADLFNKNPQLFVPAGNADAYFNSFIANERDIVQTVTAGYGMATVKLSSQASVRAGVRWEETDTVTREFDPKSRAEMLASGFPLNTQGRATTIPGVAYQYQTNPRIARSKKYDNFFPMVSFKYDIGDRLQFHTGFNKAISRPPPDSLNGAWIVDEINYIVRSPNPNLLPEYSKNFAARLAYYLEPSGQFSVTVTQNTIRNLRLTRLGTAEEFGLGDDPEFSSYEFQAPYNVPNPVRFRNLELAYSQSLTFLPDLFRGTTVSLAYTRSYATTRRSGLSPHRITGSVFYRYKRVSGRVGVVFRDDTPEQTYGRYRLQDTKYDVGFEYRINRYASLFVQGRNIFNDSQQWYETPLDLPEGRLATVRVAENYGANWNFGVKGTF